MIDPPAPVTAEALARLYDLDLQDDPGDLDLYLALADRADGTVLELAAGTGRLAVPLAQASHRVTAVDNDPAMLARARERASEAGLPDGRLELIEADLLDLELPEAGRFALAFIGLNSIMLLDTRDAQRRAIRVLADQLAPGGLAVVDAWLPDIEDLGRFDGRAILEWVRPAATRPDGRAAGDGVGNGREMLVTKTGSAIHDAATGTIVLTAMFEEGPQGGPTRRWIRQDRLRLIAADELVAFAEDAGLEVELLAGGYDLGQLGPGSERAVLIAEKPALRRP